MSSNLEFQTMNNNVTKHRFTVDDIMMLEPCSAYPRSRVEKLWKGKESLSMKEILELDVCEKDRHWAYVNLNKDPDIVFLYEDGTREWCLNGKIHREDGPAIVHADGSQCWYKNDNLHREDGPAVIHADGMMMWFKNDSLHRESGPAIVYSNGTEYWYKYGRLIQ